MLSSKVDLTENRTFSTNHSARIVEIDRDIMREAKSISGNDATTNDLYDKLVAKEEMFGRTRHYTEKLNVFKKEETAIGICDACRRKRRVPWKCNCCYYESDHKASNYNFPWNELYTNLLMARNSPNEIFNLR